LHLVENFVDGELSEPVELEFEDCINLPQRKAALFVGKALAVEIDDDLSSLAPRIQVFASFCTRARGADDLNDGVEIVEGNLVAFENVLALASLAQQIDSAALHDIDAVIDEGANCRVEAQFLGLS